MKNCSKTPSAKSRFFDRQGTTIEQSGNDMKANTSDGMLSGPIFSTFLRHSIPWSLSMLAAGSAAIVDGIFIGRYAGALPLASVNIAMPVFSLLYGVGVMLASGGAAVTGDHMGRGDMRAASAALIKTLISVGFVSLAFCLAAFAMQEKLLALLGADELLRKDCAAYLGVLLLFSPVFPLCLALSYFVRMDQRPGLASMGLMVCSALNVALDAWLIGAARMGVHGAALATGLSYCVPCLLYASHFFSSRSSYILPGSLGRWNEMFRAAWNGASECINETSAGIIIWLFNLMLMERMGGLGVAAFTVVGYVIMLGGLLSYGFADSLVPIVSVNNGARQYERTRRFLYSAALMVLCLGMLIFLFLSLWPTTVTRFFLPGEQGAQTIALAFLRAARWGLLFMGLNMVLASYFTGRLWAAKSFFIAFCRSLALPLLLLWLLPSLLGEDGIFYVSSVAEFGTFLLAAGIFILTMRAGAH